MLNKAFWNLVGCAGALVFVIVLMSSISAHGQNDNKTDNEVLDTTFCELVKNPKKFDQKFVRVRGFYQYSTYDAGLYCLDCAEVVGIDVRIDSDFEEKTPKRLLKKVKRSKKIRVVEVTAIGKFTSGPTIYHLIEFYYLESARVIFKNTPSKLSESERAKMYCSCNKSEEKFSQF
jgi:hypothetical protein